MEDIFELLAATDRFHDEVGGPVREELLIPDSPLGHVWIAVVSHRLPDDAVTEVLAGSARPVRLDGANTIGAQVGCYQCERPLSPELAAEPCAGNPER